MIAACLSSLDALIAAQSRKVCILVLKRCKRPDDVLFINASEHFVKGKRQNQLTDEHIAKFVETYQQRPEKPVERYARRVEMKEIADNDYNLNISRYVSTAQEEVVIDLSATHRELVDIETASRTAATTHNEFLKELGLSPFPLADFPRREEQVYSRLPETRDDQG